MVSSYLSLQLDVKVLAVDMFLVCLLHLKNMDW